MPTRTHGGSGQARLFRTNQLEALVRRRQLDSEGASELADLDRAGPHRRIVVEHAMHELAQLGGRAGLLGERRGLARQMHRHDLGERAAVERWAAGQRLVRDHAERVDVTRRRDVAAGRLLGRHVDRRTGRQPVEGESTERAEPRDAPVDHAQRKLAIRGRHEDIVGLEIAMHHAARVHGREHIGDLCEQRCNLVRR